MLDANSKKNIFFAIPVTHDFWEEFEFMELTINMRKRDDPCYAELLHRLRIGQTTNDDIQTLRQRLIKNAEHKDKIQNAVDKFHEILTNNQTLLCLLPTNQLVDEFNLAISKSLGISNINIPAVDSNRDHDYFKVDEKKKKKQRKSTRCIMKQQIRTI